MKKLIFILLAIVFVVNASEMQDSLVVKAKTEMLKCYANNAEIVKKAELAFNSIVRFGMLGKTNETLALGMLGKTNETLAKEARQDMENFVAGVRKRCPAVLAIMQKVDDNKQMDLTMELIMLILAV